MSFFQICLFSMIGTLVAFLLKNEKPEYSRYISLFVCVVLLFRSLGELKVVLGWIEKTFDSMNQFSSFFAILIKMIGISYVSELSGSICKEAGFPTIADGIEICTRVLLCVFSIPVMTEVIQLVEQYL